MTTHATAARRTPVPSRAIKAAESRLKTLGYSPGAIDGKLDAQAARALSSFRHDDRLGSGSALSAAVRKALHGDVAALQHDPLHTRAKPTRAHRRLDALTTQAVAKTYDGQLGLGEGVTGRAVKNVQARLRAAGYDARRSDGRFEGRTTGAVKAFQRRSGLLPTGRVDAGTWKQLSHSVIAAESGTSPSQDLGEQSAAVKRSEVLLRKLGYRAVKADGLFTRATRNAVMKFERRTHRHVDGRIGTGDLHAMKRLEARTSTRTVAGCARALLQSKNVSFWSGLSTGSDRKNLVALANGHKAFVPATGRHVIPKLKLMQALVEMAKRGHLMINALTGGHHSPNSNHYRGAAVDLDLSTGNSGMIERVARKHGGLRNFETSHIHLDF